MTITGRGDVVIFVEQIKLDPVGAGEVGIHPVVGGEFIAFLEVLFNVGFIDREDIDVFIGCPGKPGEVIDADDVGVKILTPDLFMELIG